MLDSALGLVGDLGGGLIQSSQGALDQMESAAAGIDRTLVLWAERFPILGWSVFGLLALLVAVNTWIRVTELLHTKGVSRFSKPRHRIPAVPALRMRICRGHHPFSIREIIL